MNGSGPAAGKQIQPGDQNAERDVEAIIQAVAPDSAKRMSKKQRAEIAKILTMRQTTVTHAHSGPLPSPEDLKNYDLVNPGTAQKIVAMAENQQNHRIRIEAQVITEQLVQSARGQHYALAVAMTMILASFIMVIKGHDTAGGWVGGTTLVGLVTVFITGRATQIADLKAKRAAKK